MILSSMKVLGSRISVSQLREGTRFLFIYMVWSWELINRFLPLRKRSKKLRIKKEKILFGTLPQACSWGLSIARVSGCLGPLTGTYPLVEYLSFATGWELSVEEYLKTGERILSLRKAFTFREGVTPQEVRLHLRASGIPPLKQRTNPRGNT